MRQIKLIICGSGARAASIGTQETSDLGLELRSAPIMFVGLSLHVEQYILNSSLGIYTSQLLLYCTAWTYCSNSIKRNTFWTTMLCYEVSTFKTLG